MRQNEWKIILQMSEKSRKREKKVEREEAILRSLRETTKTMKWIALLVANLK